MMEKAVAALKQLGRGKRSVEDAVGYSVGHRIRVEIQAVLREGSASASQLSKAIRRPLSTVGHHIEELLNDGVIEIARTEQVGNVVQHVYRVVELPYFSDEQVAALTEEDRQALMAYTLQGAMAEAMASLWSKKMVYDRRAFVAWKRARLDALGRDELADEEAESWARKEKIEARSTNRRAKTGEEGQAYIFVSLGFERSLPGLSEPLQDSRSNDAADDPDSAGDS